MAGFEILFEAIDEASPAIQKLSKELLEAAQRADRFAKEVSESTSKADQGFKKIPPNAKQASDSLDALQQASQQLTKQLLGFATIAGITAFFKSSADAALQEEEALRRLAFAVDATGGSFEQNKARLIAFAQEQQALTRFSDTQTFEALGRLTRVTGDVGQAMQATRLAFGLASASGKDLNTILDLLGPILNGDATRLRALKMEFGAFIGDANTSQEVIDTLSKRFLGAAESEKGFAKEIASTKNTLSDFQETVGTGVLPVFRFFLDALAQGAKFLEIVGTVLANFAAKGVVHLETLAQKAQAVFTGNFARLPEISQETASKLVAIEEESASQAAEIEKRFSRERFRTVQEEGAIKARITEDSLERARKEAEEKTKASQETHETLVKLEAERLELEKNHLESRRLLAELEKEERFRQLDELKEKGLVTEEQLLQAKLSATETSILKIQQAKEEQLKNLSEFQQAAKEISESMADAVGSAVADMILEGKNFETAMKTVFNTVLRTAIETFTRVAVEVAIAKEASKSVANITAAGFTSAGAIGILAGVATSIFKGFKFQEGGIVTRPTLGLVGERGPEAIIPLNRTGVFGNIEINVNQTNSFTVGGTRDEDVRELMRRISEVTRSGAAEGAEMVKSILGRQNRFARESV